MKHGNIMLAVLLTAATSMAAETTAGGRSPEQLLEARVQQLRDTSGTPVPRSVKGTLEAVRALGKNPDAQATACKESKWVTFGGKYALSIDESTGKNCKIYDLSFPTLKTFFGKPVSKLPVEKLTARDYLNWAEGKYDQVYQKIDDAKANFNGSRVVQAGWVSKVPFRTDSQGGLKAQSMRAAGQLPASFRASDLDVGDFRLNEGDRNQLKQLISETKAMTLQSGGLNAQAVAFEDYWTQFADRPASFLEKVRFDWNDTEKVYDVFLEGEFLPIMGPVALVDFNRQYKPAVESMLRSVIETVLWQLAKAIPHPTARNLVQVAVEDSFQFVNMMYDYQMNQLEGTMRAGLNQEIQINTEPARIQQGMNILFGSRSNLLMDYILATAQGKKFSWEEIDKIGRTARYRAEKQRDIRMINTNSKLVLNKGCSIEMLHGYFGVCSKNGQKVAMYSMISENVSFYYNWGAPVIHRYSFPAETVLLRSTSWLLSAGVRLFEIPMVPNFITRELSNQLKNFSKAGLADEAFLRNQLLMQKQRGVSLDAFSESLVKWFYIQNINPFLPKSEGSEKKIIEANAALLGLKSPVLASPAAF